jgi:hypothetical protein
MLKLATIAAILISLQAPARAEPWTLIMHIWEADTHAKFEEATPAMAMVFDTEKLCRAMLEDLKFHETKFERSGSVRKLFGRCERTG